MLQFLAVLPAESTDERYAAGAAPSTPEERSISLGMMKAKVRHGETHQIDHHHLSDAKCCV